MHIDLRRPQHAPREERSQGLALRRGPSHSHLSSAPLILQALQDLSDADVAEGGSVKVWRVEGVRRVNLAKEK